MLPMGSLVSDMTLCVVASAEVAVLVVTHVASNGDFFSPIPVEGLGTQHFAVAGTSLDGDTASFLALSAPYDDTQVNVTLPPPPASSSAPGVVVLEGVTYYPGDVITVTLNRLQTLQLQV